MPGEATRIVAANPGSHLFPDRTQKFGYGFGGLPPELSNDDVLRRYLAAPLTIYLGTGDITPEHSFDASPEGMKQGPHRYGRGRACFAAAQKLAKERGWAFNWRKVETPGIAHEGAFMFAAKEAGDALFGPRSLIRLISVALLFAVLVPSTGRSAKAERWLRLSTPEFTIFTTLGEREAAEWAGEFSQFVAALRSYFAVGDRPLPPLTMVLFARDRDFEKYRPLDAKGKPQPVAGFFGRHETWSVAGLGGGSISQELRHTIFHEGVHWFLSTAETPTPVWLEEGLAEVFATFEISKGQ
eukprot:gene8949-12095_t